MATFRSYFIVPALVLAFIACKKDDEGGSSDPAPVETAPPTSSGQPDQNNGGGGGGGNQVIVPTDDGDGSGDDSADGGDTPALPVPVIVFPSRPADVSYATAAKFTFEAREFSATAYECSFDGGAYAACTSPYAQSGLSAGRHALQVRAANGGSTVSATYAWTIDQTLEASAGNGSLPSSSLIHQINVIAGTAYIASNKGLLVATNSGASINVIDTSDGMPSNNVYESVKAGNYHFVATMSGLVISSNDWASLSVKNTGTGLGENYVSSVAYDSDAGRLFAAHDNSKISYTDNNGASFTVVTVAGLPAGATISQIFVASNGRLYLSADGKVYTGETIDSTFTEIGTSAFAASAPRIFLAKSGRLYVAAAGLIVNPQKGLFYSDDNGATFIRKEIEQAQSVVASDDNSTVYVATNDGLAISFDGGVTFSAVSTNALTGSAAVRRVNLGDDGRIYFSENYFVFQSKGAGSAVAVSQTDVTAPVVAHPASLARISSWENGISFAWTPAKDAVSSDSGLNYELFKAPAGTDLSTLAKIYLDGELISRNAGVSGGAFYPGDANNYRVAVVVGDKAGNRSIYTGVDATTGSSPSAQTWSQESADTGMGNVINQTIQQLGSSLYLVGGILGTTPFTVQNKVYKSTDGVNWSEQAQSGSVAERFQHGSAVLNSKLWIAGGTNAASTLLNDVAYTTDGATWTTATASAGFSARSNPEMVSFNGKLWIIGGNAGSGYLADVWYSSNGSSWTRATADAGFKAGSAMRVVVLGSYMYAIGEGTNQEVWRSADGATWYKLLTTRPFGSTFNFTVVSHSSRIYLVGGSTTEVWASPDGIVWEEISTGSTFPGREDHVSISFGNKIWVYHGINAGYQTDIWSGN